ncbi:MAG: AIPR family protein [Bacteroidota bacterium]
MTTTEFYKVIDAELDEILTKNGEDAYIKKHNKSVNNQKSYALLIWFLEFYGRKSNYSDFITDGNDDYSCDIILDGKDKFGEKIFYIVQSKWNNEKNTKKDSDRDEILKAISDFNTILRGKKTSQNVKLEKKLNELDQHLKDNGDVKFIFLSLSEYNGGADENIKAFTDSDDKISFEIIDIKRIRADYIDRIYKKIEPLNPLEKYQNPEESPIEIEIAQDDGNFIKIEKPFEAYMVLLKPSSIYNLFDKYGFALFYKNVRNPLLQSKFNEQIEKTAKENPAYFWYYNNGITGITFLLPSIGKKAKKIKITGLQIINGAQTVYSIYKAYKDSSPTKRTQMDGEALVTLRLLKSGGKDFDLNVTRFTNSQNPVQDRDFCANDEVQVRLQNASYSTKVWYEKRRGEFRETPTGIIKVPNYVLANTYLAYHLQDPVSVIKNFTQRNRINKDLNFISHREHKDGMYEKIFNDNTLFEDMLCSFYIFDTIDDITPFSYQEMFKTNVYHLLALFKVAFTKYLHIKFGDKINVNNYIVDIYEKGEKEIILKTFKYLQEFVQKQVEVADNEAKTTEKMMRFLFTLSHYERIKEDLEEETITADDIEKMTLKNAEEIVDGEKTEDENETSDNNGYDDHAS